MHFSESTKRCTLDILYSPFLVRDYIFCCIKGIGYDPSWRFYGLPHVFNARRRGKIRIGKNFIATSKISKNSIGVFQPVVIKCFPGAELKIGCNVGVSGCTISASAGITIGDNVLIGSGGLISDSDAHPINPFKRKMPNQVLTAPVVINDFVFIGARSIILKGVEVGKGAVIGAGSVISKDVPEFAVVSGNPAEVIGDSRNY